MYKRILATVAVASMALFSVAFAASQFSDVPSDHWAADSISWAADHGIMSGPGDMPGMFDPAGTVNRAQLATVLHRYDMKMMEKMDAMDTKMKEMEDSMMEDDSMEEDDSMMEDETVYSGDLEDVSGGSATGTVTVTYSEGSYTLDAEFMGLPALEGDDFYEGWIVMDGAPMSTGVATMDGENYVNTFTSEEDLTGYDLYILTLEADDGNPDPSEDHILEGNITEL